MKKAIILIVIAVGACTLVYGFAFHTLTVHFTEKVTVEIPAIVEDPFGEGFEEPPGAVRMETIELDEERTVAEPEPNVVLEVTRGGVERLEDGRIARTYEAGEAPPSLCPT
jgi:hypothetical protein